MSKYVNTVRQSALDHGTEPEAIAQLWDEVEDLERRYEAERLNERPDRALLHQLGNELGPKRNTLKELLRITGWRSNAGARVEGG